MRPGTRPPLLRGMVLGLLLFTIPATATAAQATPVSCPSGLKCAEYDNGDGSIDTFAFNPQEGVYQEIVVEVREETITTLSGSRTGDTEVTLAGYLENDDAYELVTQHTEPKAGIYADAELRDSYGLVELHE